MCIHTYVNYRYYGSISCNFGCVKDISVLTKNKDLVMAKSSNGGELPTMFQQQKLYLPALKYVEIGHQRKE